MPHALSTAYPSPNRCAERDPAAGCSPACTTRGRVAAQSPPPSALQNALSLAAAALQFRLDPEPHFDVLRPTHATAKVCN